MAKDLQVFLKKYGKRPGDKKKGLNMVTRTTWKRL
jgi:hypothetical protein